MTPHETVESILDPIVEKDAEREELSETPRTSIIFRGKAADDIKSLPIYFLLRNVAMRHAHVCQLFSQKLDGNVIEQLAEEAITETLLTQRKHWRIKTVKRHVRRALDRIVDRWKKRDRVVERKGTNVDFAGIPDTDEVDILDNVADPRDYGREFVEQIDRDRELPVLRRKLAALLSPAQWNFLQQHLVRDEHNPPTTGAERVRFMRLKRRLRAHLRADFEAGRFNALMDIDRKPKSSFSQSNAVTA